MYEDVEKIEDIDTLMMYKMVQALIRYDYYSTKCLVNELLKKRIEEREINNLKQIQDLLFYQKNKELEDFLIRIIDCEKKKKKKKSKCWLPEQKVPIREK